MRAVALGVALAVVGFGLPRPVRAQTVTSRVTWYEESGPMADGVWTFDGAAACGPAIPLGTVVHLVEPDIYLECHDRGDLAPYQIDVYSPSGRPWWATADYFTVEW